MQIWLLAVLISVATIWCLSILRSLHLARLEWRANVEALATLAELGSDIQKLAVDEHSLTPGGVRSLTHRLVAIARIVAQQHQGDSALQASVRGAHREAMNAVQMVARGQVPWSVVREQVQGLSRWIADLTAQLRDEDDKLSARLESETRSLYLLGGVSIGLAVLNLGFLVAWRHRQGRVQRALAARRRADASFRALIEAAPEAIFVAQQGIIVYANPAATRLLGYAAGSGLRGLAERHLTVAPEALDSEDEDSDALTPRVRTLASEETAVPDSPRALRELRLRRADGTLVPTEVLRLAAVFDGRASTVTLARDISERRHMQNLLLIAERMASVGTLAAGVGHEINNPLAYVISNLEMLLPLVKRVAAGEPLRPRDRAEIVDLVAEAREGSERIRNIVSDLKAFSRPEQAPSGPVDLARVVDLAARMASVEVRHRAQLIRKLEGVPRVQGDEGRLAQVFLNLLVNAAQAIREGNAGINEITVSGRQEGDRVIVDVSDTGTGIAPEHLDKVFDLFFTTKPVGQGTGLGLAFCHSAVHQMGGTIAVASTPGRGTTFTLSLPVAGRDAVARASKRNASTEMPEAPARAAVLVVDDQLLVSRSLKRLLDPEHDVTIAASAHDALEMLARGRRFDVILLDLTMPEMSGVDLHQAIVRGYPELAPAIVFMTGGAFTAAAREYLARQNVSLVEKPFDVAKLRKIIRDRMVAISAALRGSEPKSSVADQFPG